MFWEKFLEVAPRESAGGAASDRFDYQKDWALCHVLSLHESGRDYLVAFDVYDDVIEFDSSSNPTRIRFYQVKTKGKGVWSLAELLRRKSGAAGPLLSILGKMYDNKIKFAEKADAALFITNAPLNLPLADSSQACIDRQEIAVGDLKPEVLRNIACKLREEHQLAGDPNLESVFMFQVTDLALGDHTAHTKGKIAEFLDRVFPDGHYRAGAVYQALFAEVKIRNNRPPSLDSFENFIRRKCLSRSDLDQMLAQTVKNNAAMVAWGQVEARLANENVPVLRSRELRSQWQLYDVARRNSADLVLREVEKAVAAVLEDSKTSSPNCTLVELLDRSAAEVPVRLDRLNLYDQDYIRAVTLWQLYVA